MIQAAYLPTPLACPLAARPAALIDRPIRQAVASGATTGYSKLTPSP